MLVNIMRGHSTTLDLTSMGIGALCVTRTLSLERSSAFAVALLGGRHLIARRHVHTVGRRPHDLWPSVNLGGGSKRGKATTR